MSLADTNLTANQLTTYGVNRHCNRCFEPKEMKRAEQPFRPACDDSTVKETILTSILTTQDLQDAKKKTQNAKRLFLKSKKKRKHDRFSPSPKTERSMLLNSPRHS